MLKIKRALLIQIILLVSVSQSLGAVHNVVSFGAIADGKTLNTTAIQSAIDAANKDGGGVVSIPKGTFLSGSLMLRSNVQIHLEKGAVLLGSDLPQHYVHVALHSWCGNGWKSLIIADGAT
ncbi:MAG: polygalacturonase, partial [Bacteroidia bacterium]